MVRHIVPFSLCLWCAACAQESAPTGLQAVEQERTWNRAREAYFHGVKNPAREYKVDGTKGEIIDVRVYLCPRPELLIVTYGETYYDTTGYDVHVALMRTNDVPIYPGNVYLCPNGSEFALDWVNEDTLGVYYSSGYYPDERDPKTGAVRKSPGFQYERKIGTTTVRFVPADHATMDAKQEAMAAKAAGRKN